MAIGKRLAAMVIAGATTLACGTVSFGDVPNDSTKDWPQFRGPARDNLSKETGLLQKWPQGGPPLAWKVTGIGDGHASVAVSGGKIFTTGRDGDAVYAFAVSQTAAPQRIGFKVTAPSDGQVEVLGESRTLPLRDGRFSDDFPAYAVHLYRWRSAR